jgi:hypothetical protein
VETDLKAAQEAVKIAEDEWRLAQIRPWLVPGHFELARRHLEHVKANVERLRQWRGQIEDDARREGIPPGYLR